jgi:TetR/AcrR family transcriptional regulator, transcriptional repressor for nem operon
MPRGKTFDPDGKIDEAIDLFWRNGCDAVSVQDIVDALGINRGSLYATYGDKEQLWLLALGRYCDVRKARLAELNADQAGPVLPQVRALLSELAQPAEGLPRGCLVVNAITERTADAATREIALRQIGDVEDALTAALERARGAGEIAASASPRQLARFLVVMLQGLHVYNRAAADPRPAHDAIEVAMSAISASGQPDPLGTRPRLRPQDDR